MENLQAEIRQFVVENFLFGEGGDRLKNHDSFLDQGIIDSTGVLELVGFLEQRYGIAVEDDELVPLNLDSVDCIVRFVGRKLTTKEPGLAG